MTDREAFEKFATEQGWITTAPMENFCGRFELERLWKSWRGGMRHAANVIDKVMTQPKKLTPDDVECPLAKWILSDDGPSQPTPTQEKQ